MMDLAKKMDRVDLMIKNVRELEAERKEHKSEVGQLELLLDMAHNGWRRDENLLKKVLKVAPHVILLLESLEAQGFKVKPMDDITTKIMKKVLKWGEP